MELNPEISEPPNYAVGALCRVLQDIALESPEMWLHVFLDLLDKARLADPTESLVFTLRAALASAPQEDRLAAEAELRRFEARLRKEVKGGTRIMPEQRGALEILVVVPKEVERLACSAIFGSAAEEPRLFDTHVQYRRFPLGDDGDARERPWVTLVCMHDAGNLRAANIVRDYVSAFGRPDLAALCGMAMGMGEPKVSLGDVVVAKTVLDTGPRRVTPAGTISRFESYDVPRPLREDLLAYCDIGVNDLHEALDGSIEKVGEAVGLPDSSSKFEPSIRKGVILAGEALVESRERAEELNLHDRGYALEMEGAGFAATCSHVNCDWMVVRGVADFGEADRDKSWQGVATAGAACFLRNFLLRAWQPALGMAGRR